MRGFYLCYMSPWVFQTPGQRQKRWPSVESTITYGGISITSKYTRVVTIMSDRHPLTTRFEADLFFPSEMGFQQIRRCNNIKPTLGQCLVLTGCGQSANLPSKHETFTQSWDNAVSVSQTLDRHWAGYRLCLVRCTIDLCCLNLKKGARKRVVHYLARVLLCVLICLGIVERGTQIQKTREIEPEMDYPFNRQIIQSEFSPTWSCVSLTRSTTSSEWKLFRFDKMEVNCLNIADWCHILSLTCLKGSTYCANKKWRPECMRHRWFKG